MQIVGGNAGAEPVGLEQLPGKVNYFIGDDPSKWRSNIPTFGKVEYQDVYPGIDLVYYGQGQQLEYDFIVSPGADPSAITLTFAGADRMEINTQGDLVLHTAAGDLVQQKPYLYQEIDGTRHEVAGAFRIWAPAHSTTIAGSLPFSSPVTFDIAAYDPSVPLVIDPLFVQYSTFLGGSGIDHSDLSYGIAVDEAGNSFVTGRTGAVNFPATPGAFDTALNGDSDAFVAKLNAAGSALIYATFLGGTSTDSAQGIALDRDNNAYVSGYTFLGTFPTTPDAFDRTFNGGGYDAFVTKLSADGATLLYATFLGGAGSDSTNAELAVDSAGNAYVTGDTLSADFPVTEAFDTTYNGGGGYGDVFVTKLNASGSALLYSTFLGGGGDELSYGLAVNGAGNAYLTGYVNSSNFPTTPGAYDTTYNGGPWDAFVTKLSADGSALVYSTFLGGHNWDSGVGIAVDAAGSAYVTGLLLSFDFPRTPAAFDKRYNGHYDAFVTKLSPDGSGLVYSTFLGGDNWDVGSAVAVDGDGNAYITGYTSSPNFPTTPGALDATFDGGPASDVFVAQLNETGSTLRYSTFMGGGSGWDYGAAIALDSAKHVYVTGYTGSEEFPTTPDALKRRNLDNYDAFVVKFHSR
jgi:hypothetical protein